MLWPTRPKEKFRMFRMKQEFVKALILVLFIGAFAMPQAYSDTDLVDDAWEIKFSRGLINLVTSPAEIFRTIRVTSNQDGLPRGLTIGVIKGLSRFIMRAGAGIVEILTFPFDYPNATKSPLMEPEYVWEGW